MHVKGDLTIVKDDGRLVVEGCSQCVGLDVNKDALLPCLAVEEDWRKNLIVVEEPLHVG